MENQNTQSIKQNEDKKYFQTAREKVGGDEEMAEYVKKSDVIKIMEDNSYIMEVFGVKKKMIDGFAMCCDFADLKIVEIDDEEDD